MLWDGLLGDEADAELLEPPIPMNKEKIKQLKKELSKHRLDLNHALEFIQKEISQLTEKVETLKLVGGDAQESLNQISNLNERGQELTDQLAKLDKKISFVRQGEKILKSSSDSPSV
jgi:chromosome segregation ATPase